MYLRQANVFGHMYFMWQWAGIIWVNNCMDLKLTVIMPGCQIVKLCSCHGEFGPSDQTDFYVGPILVKVNTA